MVQKKKKSNKTTASRIEPSPSKYASKPVAKGNRARATKEAVKLGAKAKPLKAAAKASTTKTTKRPAATVKAMAKSVTPAPKKQAPVAPPATASDLGSTKAALKATTAKVIAKKAATASPVKVATPAAKKDAPAQPTREGPTAKVEPSSAPVAKMADARAPLSPVPQRTLPATAGRMPEGRKPMSPSLPTLPTMPARPLAAALAVPREIAQKAAAARQENVAATKKPVSQRHGFRIGESIVYPAHGVGQIIGIEEQEIAGTTLELFVIQIEKDKLTLRVPTSRLEAAGIRKLAGGNIVQRAMDTLKGRARIKRTMWSRRAQEYEAKINSGDLISIAEVVRDLYRSETQPEQSYSERQLYESALDRMAREIAVIDKLDEQTAMQRITEVLSKSARGRRLAEEGTADTQAA